MHNLAHSKLQKELNLAIKKYNHEMDLLINAKMKYTQYMRYELNKPNVSFYACLMVKCREEIKNMRDKITSYKCRIRMAQRDHNLKVCK